MSLTVVGNSIDGQASGVQQDAAADPALAKGAKPETKQATLKPVPSLIAALSATQLQSVLIGALSLVIGIVIWHLATKYNFNYFINFSLIESEYVKSLTPGVAGKKVEFVPELNFKTGIKFGYRNFTTYIQYSYLSEQFSDSSNSTLSNLIS